MNVFGQEDFSIGAGAKFFAEAIVMSDVVVANFYHITELEGGVGSELFFGCFDCFDSHYYRTNYKYQLKLNTLDLTQKHTKISTQSITYSHYFGAIQK